MRSSFWATALAIGASAVAGGCNLAEAADPSPLRGFVQPGTKIEHVLARVSQEFDRLDTDGDGLSMADAEMAITRRIASARASIVAELLPNDLDGNELVTADELKTARLRAKRKRCDCIDDSQLDANAMSWVAQKMKLDTDGDNAVSIKEMFASVDQAKGAFRTDRAVTMITALLTFDTNKDGKVIEEDLAQGAREQFKRFDTDGNGVIDVDEYATIRNSQ